MAFNPSPKVAAARDIALRFNQTHVIILMMNDDDGTLEYASYGTTRERCDEAKLVADWAYEELMKIQGDGEAEAGKGAGDGRDGGGGPGVLREMGSGDGGDTGGAVGNAGAVKEAGG